MCYCILVPCDRVPKQDTVLRVLFCHLWSGRELFSTSEVTARMPPLKYAYRYEYYLRQAGYVFAFVCLLVGMITRKVIDDFHNFHYASVDFAVVRCPSVRPSRWCIVSKQLKISSNFFLGPVAPSFCFLTPSGDTQFQGEPHHRGLKIYGCVNFFAIFDRNHDW